MKLVPILILVTTCGANEFNLQQMNRPQNPFPLQFQAPQTGPFVTESNLYLPPDTHAAIPYFAQKNANELQYQYLPPTGSKAPSKYPPPFPMFSTTYRPNSQEEEDDDEDDDDDRQVFISSTVVSPFDHRHNLSQNSPGPQIEITNRPIPKTVSYFNQIDRIDTKYPAQNGQAMPVSSTTSPFNHQAPMNRRMVQPPGFMGNLNPNDQMMADQMKTASYPNHHFLPAPQGYGNPTPEPVPILRLSNEMDLDGSYSYEALSADQTHVMQHGHIENLGTDHAENVVEGSYSYVGDNGQTYTVHYIADGNGFRASGDHLPVAPPVPEIIQRSIEYNLAEESSKPQHLSTSYRDDEKHGNQGRPLHYQPMVQPPPLRNLFTGRQPEAFSHTSNGATSSQSNNLQQAASTQSPVVHYEAPKEPPPRMINNAPITPQITFLASQGAHDPSQSISRMYTAPNIEGPIFRFGNLKNKYDKSKSENQMSSWQYQNPYLHESATKIPPGKQFISRSSGDPDDDIMINFGEMTQEQYARMYRSQIQQKDELYDEYEPKQIENNQKSNHMLNSAQSQYDEHIKLSSEVPVHFYENPIALNSYKNHNVQPLHYPYSQNLYSNVDQDQNYNPTYQSRAINTDGQRSPLITKDAFVPSSQTITSSYDYKSDIHEGRQLELNTTQTTAPQQEHTTLTTEKNYAEDTFNTTHYEIFKSVTPLSVATDPSPEQNQMYSSVSPSTTHSYIRNIQPSSSSYTENTIKSYDNYIAQEEKNKIYSLGYQSSDSENNGKSITTEQNFNDIIENNVFLKNLVKKSSDPNNSSASKNDSWKPSTHLFPKRVEKKQEKKEVKMFQPKTKTANDFGDAQRKPVDIAQVANLVTLKNYFESNKIKPKQKQWTRSGTVRAGHDNNYLRNHLPEIIHKNVKEQRSPLSATNENNSYKSKNFSGNTYSVTKPEDVDRMMGVAKIYKTLQRNSKLEGQGPPQLRTELIPPFQDHKAQTGLPPLGRAGPSMKSYLPPIFS